MKFQTRIVFDVIVQLLGVAVIIYGIIGKKKGTVASFFIPEQELKKVKDTAGLCKYLFPIILIFGICCVLFGMESLINDLVYELPKPVYVISVFAFLGVWTWFSIMIKKAKDKFVSQF